MSEHQINGLDVYVRTHVERNSRGYNQEHTVSVQGRLSASLTNSGKIQFFIATDEGAVGLGNLLDALHQAAAAANEREIQRQQREQLAAIQAGS